MSDAMAVPKPDTAASRFWLTWLAVVTVGVVTVGVIAFGLLLVVAPGLARQGFSLLVFSSTDRISEFGSELAQAVMGSVMVGWGWLSCSSCGDRCSGA